MTKQWFTKWIFIGSVLMLIFWSLNQMYDLLFEHGKKENPTRMLYEVSLFQFELLNNYLSDASSIETTAELDQLKQALYTANFTHEHLMLAVGTKHLSSLTSTTEINQFILRLQIGGNRKLRDNERRLLEEIDHHFDELFEIYGELLTLKGEVNRVYNDRMVELDQKISKIVKM